MLLIEFVFLLLGHFSAHGLLNHGDASANAPNLDDLWKEVKTLKTYIATVEKNNKALQNNVTMLHAEVEHWKNMFNNTALALSSLQAEMVDVKREHNLTETSEAKMNSVNSSIQSLATLNNETLKRVMSLQKVDQVYRSEVDSLKRTVDQLAINKSAMYDPQLVRLNASVEALRAVHRTTVSEVASLQGEQIYCKNIIEELQKNVSNMEKDEMQKLLLMNASINGLEHRATQMSNFNKNLKMLEGSVNAKISNIRMDTDAVEGRLNSQLSYVNASVNTLQSELNSRVSNISSRLLMLTQFGSQINNLKNSIQGTQSFLNVLIRYIYQEY